MKITYKKVTRNLYKRYCKNGEFFLSLTGGEHAFARLYRKGSKNQIFHPITLEFRKDGGVTAWLMSHRIYGIPSDIVMDTDSILISTLDGKTHWVDLIEEVSSIDKKKGDK